MNALARPKIQLYWDFGQSGELVIDVTTGAGAELVAIEYQGQDVSALFKSEKAQEELSEAIKEYYND